MAASPAHAPPTDAQLESAAALFAVLAEPTRLRIVRMLQRGPATVGEVVEELGLKQANASKQLGVLHQAGVLGRDRDGNFVRYSIRLPVVLKLCALVCGCLAADAQAKADSLR